MVSGIRVFSLAVVWCIAALPAAAQDSKQFKDWTAVCDNLRNCAAYGFDVGRAGDVRAYLKVERGGGASDPVTITMSVDLVNAASYRLAFDDPALPGLPAGALTGKESEDSEYRRLVLTEAASADALIDSIRKAKAIVVTPQPKDGKKLNNGPTHVSMSGAVAALLWIDEQQKRIDTVTALIKRGPKPASAIPQQPRAPVIVAARPAREKAPTRHPSALIAKGRAQCGEDDPESKLEAAYPLGAGQVLYEFSCPSMSGAYNFHQEYLIGPASHPRAVRSASFRWPIKIGDAAQEGPQTGLTNGAFDPKTMTLTSFDKGRGIGDCGNEEQWVWDGRAFRLALSRIMGECYGVPLEDWPVLYRAQVRR
jgi:hypothetical protein